MLRRGRGMVGTWVALVLVTSLAYLDRLKNYDRERLYLVSLTLHLKLLFRFSFSLGAGLTQLTYSYG